MFVFIWKHFTWWRISFSVHRMLSIYRIRFQICSWKSLHYDFLKTFLKVLWSFGPAMSSTHPCRVSSYDITFWVPWFIRLIILAIHCNNQSLFFKHFDNILLLKTMPFLNIVHTRRGQFFRACHSFVIIWIDPTNY